jgi:hypothetical protein
MVGCVSISQAASFRAVGFTAEQFHSTQLVGLWFGRMGSGAALALARLPKGHCPSLSGLLWTVPGLQHWCRRCFCIVDCDTAPSYWGVSVC